MSLLLISATGNRWLAQMLVINKPADSQPVGPVLNNFFCHVLQLRTRRKVELSVSVCMLVLMCRMPAE